MPDVRSSAGPSPPAAGISSQDVQAQLQRILHSPTFRASGQLGRLLTYLVEKALLGQAEALKEYVVGTEVFRRPPSFDPRTDSVVRVEAHRLRSKLQLYYANEGRDDPILIELPRGSYGPTFSRRRAAPSAETTAGSQPGALTARRRVRPSHRLMWVLAAMALIVGGTLAAFLVWRARSPGRVEPASLAVLPFVVLSDQAQDRYVAEALAEELTTALAKIPGLTVMARTSASQMRDTDLATVAQKLRVAAVVEGSLRRVGERFRVTVQLIRVPEATHLWAESYERGEAEFISMQEEIAAAVSRALRLPSRVDVAASRPPAPPLPEAYDLYLQGRYLRSLGNPDDIAEAVRLFEAAVSKDPSFALAHAAIADSYSLLAFHGLLPRDEATRKAKAAVERALSLDETIAEGHCALACIRFSHDWDWVAAEHAFKRALALNPNSTRTRTWYALGLSTRGRFDEALSQQRMVTVLDPLSPVASADLAAILYHARRYDEAIVQARQTLTMKPKLTAVHVIVGMSLMAKGLPRQAVAEYRRGLDASGRYSLVLGRLGQALAVLGERDEALRLLRQLEANPGQSGTPNTEMAHIYVGLGDEDRALACLEKAVAAHEGEVLFLNVAPVFDPLRTDPRFASLLRAVGFQP